jgi:hypothetical protein
MMHATHGVRSFRAHRAQSARPGQLLVARHAEAQPHHVRLDRHQADEDGDRYDDEIRRGERVREVRVDDRRRAHRALDPVVQVRDRHQRRPDEDAADDEGPTIE